jgi:hypothetical protein
MEDAALERRMAADGWTWDGVGPDDIEGRFVKPGHPSLTIEDAWEYCGGGRTQATSCAADAGPAGCWTTPR